MLLYWAHDRPSHSIYIIQPPMRPCKPLISLYILCSPIELHLSFVREISRLSQGSMGRFRPLPLFEHRVCRNGSSPWPQSRGAPLRIFSLAHLFTLIRKRVAPHDPGTFASSAVHGHARGEGLTSMCVLLV